MLIAFHKPYGVLSQFTQEQEGPQTLAAFGFPKHVYPIGRLDSDSEGLLLLSDEKPLVDRLLNPKHAHPRTYHVQVERIPTAEALDQLRHGILLRNQRTLPCQAIHLDPQPSYAPRIPPIRIRPSIPDTWISLTLTEGRNRQVRHMTAAIGHPTLRLIRVSIGDFPLHPLEPGKWKILNANERASILS